MIKWPNNKKFAFTIIDDTDKATVYNVKPVYDYLYKSGLLTSKTVWSLPSRDEFGGESLSDKDYKDFIVDIANKGFEIGFHGAGSGNFIRAEVLYALDKIKDTVGYYPKLHINHAFNSDNLYWNSKRFAFPFNFIYNLVKKIAIQKQVKSLGDEKESRYFWGDFAKQNVKYTRNRVFSKLNTIGYDKLMPYREKSKEAYSNYWFSSSDGFDCKAITKLLSKRNINKLEKQNGCAIVYTHFAFGFVMEGGALNEEFKNCIDIISSKDGWFVPASELLDYINNSREKDLYIGNIKNLWLDIIWFGERIIRKIFWRV
ncbi:hypothetical protein G9F72_023240 [Clostridium estertheticum]|uniref:hypothetical protein n=1 Tax=Clostridium estertheticum TaxID=238834 RepID=UPI0013E9179B|nr:hypothetical protein [Clostridium estertheticum]MBZ9689217.1 hypothetical protein [Clostridium estertheticum]